MQWFVRWNCWALEACQRYCLVDCFKLGKLVDQLIWVFIRGHATLCAFSIQATSRASFRPASAIATSIKNDTGRVQNSLSDLLKFCVIVTRCSWKSSTPDMLSIIWYSCGCRPFNAFLAIASPLPPLAASFAAPGKIFASPPFIIILGLSQCFQYIPT